MNTPCLIDAQKPPMRTVPNYWELAKKEKIIQFIQSILLDLLGGLSISITLREDSEIDGFGFEKSYIDL